MGLIAYPLDEDAMSAADDRFYAEHPEMEAADGTRTPLDPDNAAHGPLRDRWEDIYVEELKKAGREARPPDPADETDPIDPTESCPGDKPCLDCTPIASINLVSLSYTKDHGLLKDNETDWKNTGVRYAKPDWTADGTKKNPVSVSLDEPMDVEIEYEVLEKDACPETGTIDGRSFERYSEDAASFSPGAVAKHEPSKAPKPHESIDRWSPHSIHWKAHAKSGHSMGGSENELFVTFGPSLEGEFDEDGATLKRMRASVDLAGDAGSIDEFKIVEYLFGKLKPYVLSVSHLPIAKQKELADNPATLTALKKENWPTYFESRNGGVGPWPIYDHQAWGAECQAFCRFIRGIMRQIGAKGKYEFRTYTANFDDPETVLYAGRPSGPKSPKYQYALADAPVEVGETYWNPVDPLTRAPIGWNNFEAYLKYTPPGGRTVRLFGGGVGLLPPNLNPLHVFPSITEIEFVERKKKNAAGRTVNQTGWKVIRLHEYDRSSWSGTLP